MRLLILAIIMSIANASAGQFFQYHFSSSPDSAEVYLNGIKHGYTPCLVKFNWSVAKDSGKVHFEVKADGYHSWEYTLDEKNPRAAKKSEHIELALKLNHDAKELTKHMVVFDKLLADQFTNGHIIGKHKLLNGTVEDLKWEGRIKVGEKSFARQFIDIASQTGIRTPETAEVKLFSDLENKPQMPRFALSSRLLNYFVIIEEKRTKNGLEAIVKTTMDFEWQLLDRKTEKVVFIYSNSGRRRERMKAYNAQPDIVKTFRNGLVDLINQNDFYQLLGADMAVEPSKVEEIANSISLKKISANHFEKLSEMIKHSQKACVTIVTEMGHGSGVIVSTDGYIMTAAHVVEGVHKLQIQLSEGLSFDAELVAFDKKSDIALLKMPGSGYRALPISEDSDLPLGEDVITIGTPAGIELGQSISKGIISGKRMIEDMAYVQANISVSPGNSGGPLLNEKGEIIGIISWKIVSEGVEGIGFAIPMDVALKKLNLSIR